MATDILTRNFFELFDIPVSYEVDLGVIQQRYRELQKAVHPDKFVNATAQEKRISMQQTSWVNEAFNVLKQPVERASYLLNLKGIDFNIENETTKDAEFLMEQMKIREDLSEVSATNDPLLELSKTSSELKDKIFTMGDKFSKAYIGNSLDEAKECVLKMQFIQKAIIEADRLSSSIEDELL